MKLKRPHIFHHPVGIFPAGARWYLAGISIFALLCVAMHLSIQAHAQQRAEILVQTWADQAHIQIGEVRYHLLRNALILQNIHITRHDDNITIEHMLIRSNPESLNSTHPHIEHIEISGITAELHQANGYQIWQHDQGLMKIWQAAKSLNIQQGQVSLYLQKDTTTPLLIRELALKQRIQSNKRMLSATASLYDGSVQWHLTNNLQKQASDHSQLSWQHVNTRPLTTALALQSISGQLNGNMAWQDSGIQTDMWFDSSSPNNSKLKKNQPTHHLQLIATQIDNVWDMNIHANAWPLAPWSDFLPHLGQYQLMAGQLDGSIHWRGTAGNWRINGSQGVLREVRFSNPQLTDSKPFSWANIKYDGFNIDMLHHRLHLSKVELNDGNLSLNTSMPDNTFAQPTPHLWHLSADHMQVKNLALAMLLPDGKIILKSLDGQLTWPKRQDLSFKLQSNTSKETPDLQWRLRGKANQQLNKASISIQAKHIPLTHLRPLLPLQGDYTSPVTLAGSIDLQAKLSMHHGIWRMQGKAKAHDVHISHAGDSWLADQVSSHFGPVGMALDVQRIEQVKVDNWLYIAALEPLLPSNHAMQAITPHHTAWWTSAFRHNALHIHQLNFTDGTISMGQRESVWAKQVNIQIDDMATKHWSNIKAKANVGGGVLTLQGQWHALSNPQRFRGTASLQQALPFFLQPWMTASGMPRLIRGYIDGHLSIRDGIHADSYQAKWELHLSRGMIETGQFPNDPMFARSGFNTGDLFRHLAQGNERVKLQHSLSGSWQQQPLTFDMIGQSLQNSLPQTQSEKTKSKEKITSKTNVATYIRLHPKEVLSLNERNRILKVIQHLRQHPDINIDLRPRWTGTSLTSDMLHKIQRTQRLIERYMVYHKIDKQRIFPRWPIASDQVRDISAIQIELTPPQP